MDITNGWSQCCRLHVCVAGDGRHEEVAIKRFGRMPKVFMQRTEDHVIITCEVNHEKVNLLWQQLNEDISRNTLGEPYEPSPLMPDWIRTWAVSVTDDVAGI